VIAVPAGTLLALGIVDGFAAEKAPTAPTSEIVPTSQTPRQYTYEGHGFLENRTYEVKVRNLFCGDVRTTVDGDFSLDITHCVPRSRTGRLDASLVQKGQIVNTASLNLGSLD